jgi:hypothetical protein
MKKLLHMLKGMFYMVKKHKLYFLIPLLAMLLLVGLLIYYIGPSVIVSFIYAGV